MAPKRLLIGLIVTTISALISACSVTAPNISDTQKIPEHSEAKSKAGYPGLVIATWNTEHLAFPLADGCRPRSEAESTKLKQYAKSINADIIALQEVASVEAVELLFPKAEWQIIISDRANSKIYDCRKSEAKSTQQKVAFAVKNHIHILNSNSIHSIGLEREGLRYALELTVDSPFGAITLLNVHMKSGCFVDNYSRSDSKACQTFAKQVPFLQQWADKKELAGKPYMILGDFNHRLTAPYNHLTRQLSLNADNSESSLENLGSNIIACHPYYPAPIDHILAGNMSEPGLTKTVAIHPFDDMAPNAMLSDHCALSITLSEAVFPLSNSVKWQTASKEYRYLTSATYQRATKALKTKELPSTPWVIVMDVDETVLDNSQYQVSLEKKGMAYTPKTWNDWVASEQATLVPGVDNFIKTVFQKGGKLALVTNRNRDQDTHTWKNLRAVGLEVSTDNTCLIGRAKADKSAVDGKLIINDKDLRRQQLENGTASCYQSDSDRALLFPAMKIIMQVGDNIEDFSGVTQEDVDVKALLPRAENELILVPNPMYGSW